MQGLLVVSTGIGHTAGMIPVAAAPVQSPATLADDLLNLQYDVAHPHYEPLCDRNGSVLVDAFGNPLMAFR